MIPVSVDYNLSSNPRRRYLELISYNLYLLSLLINSSTLLASQGPGDIDKRVEAFLEMFEAKLLEMTSDEFKV